MPLKRGRFSVYPQRVGQFASMSMSAADLSMASWLNDGPKSTLKISSASLPTPFSRPHNGDGSGHIDRSEPASNHRIKPEVPCQPPPFADENREAMRTTS